MDLNIKQMKELVELFEDSNLSEISVQQDNFQVIMKKNSAGETKTRARGLTSDSGTEGQVEESEVARQEESSAEAEKAEEKAKEGNVITSPIVGTFYRSASPEEPAYVEVGDRVEKGDTVRIVEAMKVMNEVKAEKGGTIEEICVDDGDSVEYGQKLFELSSADEGN